MVVIDEIDATKEFELLLERALKGEEITITRRGKPVAKLVPSTPSTNPDNRRIAVQAIRDLADSINAPKLRWEEIKKMRDEGRR